MTPGREFSWVLNPEAVAVLLLGSSSFRGS